MTVSVWKRLVDWLPTRKARDINISAQIDQRLNEARAATDKIVVELEDRHKRLANALAYERFIQQTGFGALPPKDEQPPENTDAPTSQ